MSASAAELASNGAWRLMPCEHDGGPAARAAIGLVTLCNDVTIEPELRNFLPIEGVSVYASRVPNTTAGTVESLRLLEGHITAAAALIVPDIRIDVMAFGCTSGSMAIGPDVVAERIREARPGMACTNPVSAAAKGLRALGCKRIALLDPYTDEVNVVVERYVSGQGFDIVDKGSFKQRGDPNIVRVPPQAIFEAGLALASPASVDGLFISCTALRVSPVIGRLEEALGKPVVSSNQALAWDCLRLAGCDATVPGFGRLLAGEAG